VLIAMMRLLGRLPLPILYHTLSPSVSFLLYRVAGYRREVVVNNIANSFPQMPELERHALAKRYYRHLGHLTAEILRAQFHSEADLKRRVRFKNIELLEQTWSEGKSIMIMALHQSNWEWLLQAGALALTPTISVVYKPLHNQAMDRYLYQGRNRFHCNCIAHKTLLKQLDSWPSPFFFCLLADQTPMKKSPKAWAPMMGQDTAFPLGAEIIAEKTEPVVIFCKMLQTQLGYYEVEFLPVSEPPYQLDEHRILTRYAELATESITEQPHTWLWSNRRWRYGKEEDAWVAPSRQPPPSK
jgi:KDO2-lipid IV(A) lauroyltransferase